MWCYPLECARVLLNEVIWWVLGICRLVDIFIHLIWGDGILLVRAWKPSVDFTRVSVQHKWGYHLILVNQFPLLF